MSGLSPAHNLFLIPLVCMVYPMAYSPEGIPKSVSTQKSTYSYFRRINLCAKKRTEYTSTYCNNSKSYLGEYGLCHQIFIAKWNR